MGSHRAWLGALSLALASASSSPASAQTYDFKFTDLAGALLATGTLTTDPTLQTFDAGLLAQGVEQGRTVTAMTGSFMGQPITFASDPYAPQTATYSVFIGNNELLASGPLLVDVYGLLAGTSGSLGPGNLLGELDANGAATYRWLFVGKNYQGVFSVTQTVGAPVALPGGTMAAPAALPSGSIAGVSGAIGPGALEQYYSFQWNGGAFATTASVTGAAAGDLFDLILFGNGVLSQAQLNAADGFIGGVDLSDLAPGKYVIGLSADVNVDPDFTIQFDTPVGSAVPEASVWAMLLTGFGAGGAALRRRRGSVAPGAAIAG